MNKKEYMKWVCKFGLGFFSWLKILPCCDEQGKPITLKHAVPLVYYPIAKRDKIVARVKAKGFHFANSTILYVTGYHIPKGYEMRALVKTVQT